MSYKEQRELETLPATIEQLENEQRALHEKICGVDYHRVGAEQMRRDRERASEIDELITSSMERWEQLEALASRLAPQGDRDRA